MVSGVRVALVEKSVCDDLVIARFERPEGYTFRAGQWFRLTIDTAEGPLVHTFSHASTPADPIIEFATRATASAYKQALLRMEPGEAGTLAGPGGRLTLPSPPDRTVFLVGGVGITPVRGLLRDAVQRSERFDDAVLIYGNRDQTCVAYLDELQAMAGNGVRTVSVFETANPDWTGDTGLITEKIVRREVGDIDDRLFVVAGPPLMVEVMKGLLGGMGVRPERTTVESFGTVGEGSGAPRGNS